jgi:hypothetical protein
MDEKVDFSIIIISSILPLCVISGWILTWINTSDMSKDPSVKKYYENNLYSSIAIAISIILNLLFRISQFNLIYMGIPVLVIWYGYINLWTNTALMKSDSNAKKYYKKNKDASLLIGIPIAIYTLFVVWAYFNGYIKIY